MQILKESLSFLPYSHLQSAFTFKHILVDSAPVDPSFRPSLGQTIEYIFHRHEPEVEIMDLSRSTASVLFVY